MQRCVIVNRCLRFLAGGCVHHSEAALRAGPSVVAEVEDEQENFVLATHLFTPLALTREGGPSYSFDIDFRCESMTVCACPSDHHRRESYDRPCHTVLLATHPIPNLTNSLQHRRTAS